MSVVGDSPEYQREESHLIAQLEEYRKLRELTSHPSWQILESKVKDAIKLLSDRVMLTESISQEQFWGHRGQVLGLKFYELISDEVKNEGARVSKELAELQAQRNNEV